MIVCLLESFDTGEVQGHQNLIHDLFFFLSLCNPRHSQELSLLNSISALICLPALTAGTSEVIHIQLPDFTG